MEAKYWVPKHEVPYDSAGNENKGVYRQYIIELTVRNKDEVGFVYIGHIEIFCRETDAWENERDYILEKEPDLSEWRQVLKTECNEPEGWTLFRLDKLRPKKMFKYVETFDEVKE